MLTHVDKLSGALYALECSFEDSLWTTYECYHSTVGRLARIHVQNFHTTCLLDRSDDRIDDFHVAALAEIRHAFDDSFHKYMFVFL